MKKTKKKEKILKLRYRILAAIARFLVYPVTKFVYRAKIERFRMEKGQNYLILSNHQTPFDMFFPMHAIKGAPYFMLSEDITSNGFWSKVLNFCTGLVPIKKQTTDIKAVMKAIRVAKGGASILIFPEGNRTYSGETCYIKPSITSLIKVLKLPVAFFKIRGGYGAEPRWSNVKRKGKMICGVQRVIKYEDYKDLSDDELYELVRSELYENENDYPVPFYHKKSAEHLERLLYVCPHCGLSAFESKNDTVRCATCKKAAIYTPNKTFQGDFPFKTVLEWYNYQQRFLSDLDFDSFKDEPVFTDKITFSEVVPYKRKKVLSKNATAFLYGDRAVVKTESEEFVFDFSKIEATSCLGRNKLNVYYNGKIYQMRGYKSFNVIKYLNFQNIYSQKKAGKTDDLFFGI